jgi:hypothetical protein
MMMIQTKNKNMITRMIRMRVRSKMTTGKRKRKNPR